MPATTTVTADNVATLFPDVDTSLARSIVPSVDAGNTPARESGDLEGYDEEQVRLMDEVCIVLDNEDRPIGSASKKTCKLQENPRACRYAEKEKGEVHTFTTATLEWIHKRKLWTHSGK